MFYIVISADNCVISPTFNQAPPIWLVILEPYCQQFNDSSLVLQSDLARIQFDRSYLVA